MGPLPPLPMDGIVYFAIFGFVIAAICAALAAVGLGYIIYLGLTVIL